MTLEARHAILDALLAVLDEEHAIGLMDHRKAKKAPLTPLSTKILLKQLRLCPNANEAVEEMINRNWTGLKADWLLKPQHKTGRRNFVDAALDRMNGHGTESVFVDRRTPERLSSEQQRPGFDAADIRGGVEGYPGSSRH